GQSRKAGSDGSGRLPAGTQYWQLGKSAASTAFAIEVLNQTAAPLSYALTLDRSNDAVSATDNALPAPAAPPIAAASVPQAQSAAPVAAAANTTGDGASPNQAPVLAGTVTGSLAPGQSAWYTYAHDA